MAERQSFQQIAQGAQARGVGSGGSTPSSGSTPSNLVNPGGVYQSYNSGTGVTTYGLPPTSYTNSIVGTGPSVVTPSGIPTSAQVAQSNGKFMSSSPQTNFTQPNPEIAPNSIYSQNNNKFIPEAKKAVSTVLDTKAFAGAVETQKKASDIISVKERVNSTLQDLNALNKIANKDFINAAIKAKYGRDANAYELGLKPSPMKADGTPLAMNFAGKTVADVAKALGLPYAQSQSKLPGATEMPETQIPADPSIANPDGTIDIVKFEQDLNATLKSFNDLITQEREAFDLSIIELGNQPGVAMPLIQGQQAYQNNIKEVRMNRLLDEKKTLLETADTKLKLYDYARQLRKDQQDSIAKTVELMVSNGVYDKTIADKYAKAIGVDPNAMYDILAVAAANQKAKMASDIANSNRPDMQVTGQYYDENTGQMVNQYQYYDPTTKTWKSAGGNTTSNPNTTPSQTGLLTPGVVGGQCGDYVHKIVDGVPTMGDLYEQKMKIANVSTQDWQIGDMLIQKTKMPYGHVSVVTAINGDNVTVTESNWNNDEKVGTRVIKKGDKSVSGVYRGGTLKQQETSTPTPTVMDNNIQAWAETYASTGTMPAGVPKNKYSEITQAAKMLPKPEGAIIDKGTGILSKAMTPTQKDAYAAMLDLQKKTIELKDAFSKINTGVLGGTFGYLYDNKDRTTYVSLRNQVVDLLSRARSGAALTTSEEQMYKAMLPGAFNKSLFLGGDGETKLQNFFDAISGTIDTKLGAFNADIVGRQKTIDGQIATRAYQDGVWGWEIN